MSVPHYITFIGASAALSDELRVLNTRLHGVRVVAPAVKQAQVGLTPTAIERAIKSLIEEIRSNAEQRETARLSVWSFEPHDHAAFQDLWNVFGRAAWIEFLPPSLKGRDRSIRIRLEERVAALMPMLHEISFGVFHRRTISPLPMPLMNFRSAILQSYQNHWYSGLDLVQLKRELGRLSNRFYQQHRGKEQRFRDERNLLFEPAKPTVCHGTPHPLGDDDLCYVAGRFRFGVAIYPGHHYEVTSERGLLNCTLHDCNGNQRDMRPERRKHINVFPNDHLLPERHK